MKNINTIAGFLSIVSLLLLASCSKDSDQKIFTTLDRSDTGIDFSNNLTENDSLNYFTYNYIYLGGGVATGDINNDGLVDIYFTGNQVSNKLYLNKGNLKFEDITEKAGVGGDSRWYTGVAMADVNGDGFLDIYCSVGGKFGPKNNQLYINNGNGTFTEKAKEYGIDDVGNSVQGTFFDYDKDGDLDLFVANYPPTKFNSATGDYVQMMLHVKDNESGHLYRNDGNHFTNVTEQAGVKNYGLSLSATVGDLNNDSWPDIYVSNDFNSPDFLYINNQDGTFKEVVKEAMAHNSFYGMGVDISDFNNDGNLDLFQVDMDAKDNRRKKANMSSMNPKLFWDVIDAGFNYQYMHNCMQLNTGVYENGIPHFGNVSRITGTSSTDWSWGPLFADFDNDGNKDLFVTNGTRREINNNDFFHSLETLNLKPKDLLKKSQEIPSEKIDNFMFQNNGNLNFEQANKKWGIEYKGFSNGVAYVDLDNDGDLDIVVNNIDDYASVFENSSSKLNNYLKVDFKGNSKNVYGLGNRVYVRTKKGTQMQELTLTRGFQSSVAPELHFGVGKENTIDEVKVVWTNGKVQKLNNVKANQTLHFKEQDAKEEIVAKTAPKSQLFATETKIFPVYKHEENKYDDFKDQVLLPHKMSTFGPVIAVGDLNKDGLDDYFIGGSATYSGKMFFQTKNGFVEKSIPALELDKASEDTGTLIFDADNDGDNDLYVVSGGYEFLINDPKLQDRLYINNGKGDFTKASAGVLPSMLVSGSKVYPIDYDKDGKQDLLVLGRQVPGQYPSPTTTYLLHNISTATQPKFEISKKAPKEFINLGMATSAVITDINNDKLDDIIVVGEWMPIRIFQNSKAGFKEVTKEMGLNDDTTGWWWSIQQGDFDKDGDMDYIVGNNGLNYKYKATPDETFDIFVKDFDNDKHKDIVLSYYNDGKQYPVRGRGCSSQQIPNIKKKFKDYESFSEATLVDVYTEKSLKEALHYKVKSFASIYLENKNGKFVIHELPVDAQLSCINQIMVDDYDKDGNLDALITGNMYNSEVETPRNDAGHGLFLKGNGKGKFKSVTAVESGFFTPGDVKNMEKIKVQGKTYLLVTKNNSFLQSVRIN
ncbi:VCBS repeat-containing protein [Flavobacterium sp. KACC 22761]|uniref:VCBS repeat-containing protein n=1 Tax=Flavobacterium sp. KACC 22761 TaxID=3092665 RepID=UPI002A7620F3|nr:VCBS repeat-containing protein [Flavobacterium sp. KACC 22761]WPO78255.1 VCBS repeat-containing protein [Flavobacterium sp. KACC 22761]